MRLFHTVIGLIIYVLLISCYPQTKSSDMNTNKNPLICDIKTGLCEISPSQDTASTSNTQTVKDALKIIYFTDPICSSCWGIEPQLRKLKLEYGKNIEIEYYMGGLLPDWSYNSGGISQPSDVAKHWDEVSHHYNMPIDGDIWLEDPLDSSYPPSIAFKAAQRQSPEKAIQFLRNIREMVFLSKKNITKWDHLLQAAQYADLDIEQFTSDFNNTAVEDFEKDLSLSKKLGVRGFPTLFFSNSKNTQITLYGFRPYHAFQHAVNELNPLIKRSDYDTSWEYLFSVYQTLTTKEFSELSNLSIIQSEQLLKKLSDTFKIERLESKNGPLWISLNQKNSK